MSSIHFAGRFVEVPVQRIRGYESPGVMAEALLLSNVRAVVAETGIKAAVSYFKREDTVVISREDRQKQAPLGNKAEYRANVTFYDGPPEAVDHADQLFVERSAGHWVGAWMARGNSPGFRPKNISPQGIALEPPVIDAELAPESSLVPV